MVFAHFFVLRSLTPRSWGRDLKTMDRLGIWKAEMMADAGGDACRC